MERHPRTPVPGLADALFAKAQQRVLAMLFGNPQRATSSDSIRLNCGTRKPETASPPAGR